MTGSFLDILRVHDRLGEAFFAHQRAVLARDFDLALDLIRAYRALLFKHMCDEEDLLLPIYEREPPPPHGKVEFFVHEHRKLLEYIDESRELLAAAAAARGDDRERAILALLDTETQLKHFAEHHEMREERWLFPACDRLATAEEKRDLLARCLRE